jgi:hypothetical protein
MPSVRFVLLTAGVLLAAACSDDPVVQGPDAPPPLARGVQAFLQVSNDHAEPGERVEVFVKVQVGTETEAKVGSYTGRLTFDPKTLAWMSDVDVNDGVRVVNPNGAGTGVVRFAGASPRGFEDLTLYHGVFEVKDAGYLEGMAMEMEELSQALTLTNLQPSLQVAPRVFLRQDRPR